MGSEFPVIGGISADVRKVPDLVASISGGLGQGKLRPLPALCVCDWDRLPSYCPIPTSEALFWVPLAQCHSYLWLLNPLWTPRLVGALPPASSRNYSA